MSENECPVEPFSDLQVKEGSVRATLLHDPSVEGLDVGLYVDGSGEMKDEYADRVVQEGGGFWWDLFGGGAPANSEVQADQVSPQARSMLEYLASKDRKGKLRVAYWATGNDGRSIEVMGEVGAADLTHQPFRGPAVLGQYTVLMPALQDFFSYFRSQVPLGAKRGCCVFLTDGLLHDAENVKAFSLRLAEEIGRGRMPRINLFLVGVGSAVDEEQIEDICLEEYPGVGQLWCHRLVADVGSVGAIVADLVDDTLTVAPGGVVYDDQGQVLKVFEGRLPAVLEFKVPAACAFFELEVSGKRYRQPLAAGAQA